MVSSTLGLRTTGLMFSVFGTTCLMSSVTLDNWSHDLCYIGQLVSCTMILGTTGLMYSVLGTTGLLYSVLGTTSLLFSETWDNWSHVLCTSVVYIIIYVLFYSICTTQKLTFHSLSVIL